MSKYIKGVGFITARTIKERFELKIQVAINGCWEWTGSIRSDGYGQFGVNKKIKGAHRFSYELYIGEIPDGLLVCHTCDNKICVNPNHLFLGTSKDNMVDAQNKGRVSIAKCPSITLYTRGCRCDECIAIYKKYMTDNDNNFKAKKAEYHNKNKEKFNNLSREYHNKNKTILNAKRRLRYKKSKQNENC